MPEINPQDTGFCPHGNYQNLCDICRFEYLREVKEQARDNFEKTIEDFGLKKSQTFNDAYNKMEAMSHGPYHQEGSPNAHVSLVLYEMNKIIVDENKSGDGFTPDEVKTLRLSSLLHDIGKPESSFVDLPTKKHIELFKDAKKELDPIALTEAEKIRTEILDSMMPGKRSKDKEMKLVRTPEFQSEVAKRLLNANDEIKRVFVPRFFDHETFSANMVDKIIEEAQIDLSEEQKIILEKLIGNHMALYADNNGVTKLVEKVLVKDGQFDERLWKMLKAQVRSDSRGTYAYGEPDRDSKVDKLIGEIEKAKNKN